MKISKSCVLMLASFILFSLTAFNEPVADEISNSAGFTIGCKGWSRGTPEDEKESEGWVFYNCEKGKMDDADTMAVVFWEYADATDRKDIENFYKAMKNQYIQGYPGIRFQPYSVDGKEVELGISWDDEGGTLYTFTMLVKNRIYNFIAVKFGRHERIPDDLKRLLASIQTVKEPPVFRPIIETADLTAVSLMFRRSAAGSFQKAIKSFNGEKAFEFMLNKNEYIKNSDAWAMLFNGSYMLLSTAGIPDPVTCYYHPLYDTAVLVQWRINNKRVVSIDRASLVTGTWQSDRESGKPFTARWLWESDKPETAIKSQTLSFIRLFEKKFPPDYWIKNAFPGQASVGLVQSVFDMCRMQMEVLVALQDKELTGIQKCIRDFRIPFIKGNKTKLQSLIPEGNPVKAGELLGLPDVWRRGAVPVFAMPGTEKLIVFLGNDNTPGCYIVICINKVNRPFLSSVGVLYQSDIEGGR